MPNLQHSLRDFDYRHLQLVGDLWGIPVDAPDARRALPLLAREIKDPALVREVVEALPAPAAESLAWLVREGGRVSWAMFTRRCGEVREMGPGRRDRERPDLNPVSPAEVLWYRAFLARGFFDTETGPQEFAYIPDDLLEILADLFPTSGIGNGPEGKDGHLPDGTVPGRPATPDEREYVIPTSDRIIDHTCTLLAGLRMGIDPRPHLPQVTEAAITFFETLLSTMEVLDPQGEPKPEAARDFLSLSRPEALLKLWQTWLTSSAHNDLRLVPGLQAEGAWENDPLRVRKEILGFLSRVPRHTWWSISGTVAHIKKTHPDFQRPSGDYDSWFLKDSNTGEYLRGFKHWDEVEGALLRYTITGPLHWLGLLDLAAPEDAPQSQPSAFRFSFLSHSLLDEELPKTLEPENASIHIRSKGEIDISALVPRTVRYQVARFCAWETLKQERYSYWLTSASLEEAEEHGLRTAHLLALLQSHAEVIPPNVLTALEGWEQRGVEASLGKETILRVTSPAMLEALQKSRGARFLREQLGPTAVVIKEGSEEKVAEILIELGFLVASRVPSPEGCPNGTHTNQTTQLPPQT